jgi:hypothetical protein
MEKKSLNYERYLFRLIVQDKSESFDSFVERIKFQSQKCSFADEEGTIIDQIIEKCSDNELRNKAFENQMTLNQLVLTGKILEQAAQNSNTKTAVESPKRDYERSTSNRSYERRSPPREQQECSRCGKYDHDEFYRNCPAKRGLCRICRKPGHYALKCFEKEFKRARSRSPRESKRIRSSPESIIASTSRRQRLDSQQNENESHNITECRWKITSVESLSDPTKLALNSNSQSNIQIEPSANRIPQTSSSIAAELGMKFYKCEIGGMLTKYTIKQSYPANVISRGLFRKFRDEKHHSQTCDMVPISMENMKFIGHFTTHISGSKLDKQYCISFHIREGNEDFVIINKKMAQLLKLIP